jgi:hypothetical protein
MVQCVFCGEMFYCQLANNGMIKCHPERCPFYLMAKMDKVKRKEKGLAGK